MSPTTARKEPGSLKPTENATRQVHGVTWAFIPSQCFEQRPRGGWPLLSHSQMRHICYRGRLMAVPWWDALWRALAPRACRCKRPWRHVQSPVQPEPPHQNEGGVLRTPEPPPVWVLAPGQLRPDHGCLLLPQTRRRRPPTHCLQAPAALPASRPPTPQPGEPPQLPSSLL